MPDLSPVEHPHFVSTQVTEAERYYLNLAPRRSTTLGVVCGGCEFLHEDYVVTRTTFPYFCIEFVTEGAGSLELRGKRYPLHAGVAFAYAPGIPHTIKNDPRHPMRKYYVDFAGKTARALLGRSSLGEWKAVQLSAPEEVRDIFASLQRDALDGGALRDQLCAAHLHLLLLKIAQKALPAKRRYPRSFDTYQRARRYMETHFATLRTAEEAARGCHMGPVHLSRVFSRFGRTTPYEFLLRLKMNRAATRLSEPNSLVKQVAEELGFSSPYQFSRAFKRIHGVAPNHFSHRGQSTRGTSVSRAGHTATVSGARAGS